MTVPLSVPAGGPTSRSWPEVLSALIARRDLDADSVTWAMREIMAGEASPVQVAGFLVALRSKGETVEEITALAEGMLAHASRFSVDGDCVDVVGTGGDRAHTVNISTMAALVVAGTGAQVVKHGNRSASSSSGSADVLEALGLDLTLNPEQVAEVARRARLTFCFAQVFHPSMRHAAVARRDLGVGTVFNFLGPLTNPAQPRYAAVGVADARMAPLLAGVFARRGQQAAVFRGDDGLDELTLSTTSSVWWVGGGDVTPYVVDPPALGLAHAPMDALRGASAAHNAGVVRDVLSGAVGPVRDAVVLNAGIALAVLAGESVDDQASFVEVLSAGMDRAAAAIDEGAATAALDRWIAVTREVAVTPPNRG